MMTTRGRRGRLVAALSATVALVLATGGATAVAAAPAWRITALTNTAIAPGGSGAYLLAYQNIGDASADGTSDPITFTASLPSGLQATGVTVLSNPLGRALNCFGTVFPASTVTCRDPEVYGTGFNAVLSVAVRANPALLPGVVKTATFTIAGGGAAAQSTVAPIQISDALPGFGVDKLDGAITADAAGTPSTQAGGRPYAASVSFDANTQRSSAPIAGDVWPAEPLKDVYTDLPPGLAGNPTTVDQCTSAQLANTIGLEPAPLCPVDSQVGTALVRLNGSGLIGIVLGPVSVFNMVPPPGVPARFGFNVVGTLVTLDAKVKPGPDYGLAIAVNNTPEAIPFIGATVTLWGVPSDAGHDAERACPGFDPPGQGGPSCPSTATTRLAFLRNSTSCTAPADSPVQDGLVTTVHADSWIHPGRLGPDGLPDLTDPAWKSKSFVSHVPPGYPFPSDQWGAHLLPTGCDAVPFAPALSGQPAAGAKPASPSGFSFDLTLPQSDDPLRIAEGDLKTAVVTLPAGVSVSPSSANGLAACSSAQIALNSGVAPTCPDASKIGTVEVRTPLLRDPLEGKVYLAAQGDNPFGSLLAIYIVAHGPGFFLKLPGHVEADPITGQLKTTFDNNPQLPFTDLHLAFDGGPHAALVLPAQCGPYTTHAVLTSWSGKTVQSDSVFTVDGDASDCSSGTSFSPSFAAGTETTTAGSDSTFDLRLVRDDRDQQLKSIALNLPSGLTGRIASADLCGDAQAAAGTCPDGSRVGSVTVGAGPGIDPVFISDGRAYLTGPYKGAPFGLSIVVPAKAGPFDLGNVVVRSALFVDKHTANVTVVSDPLPSIVQGIPLDVRDVRVSVDKPHFFVNPTSCAQKTIYGTFGSTAGAIAHASTRFQVGGCERLKLAPRMVLTIGSRGHTAAGDTIPFSTTLTMPRGQETNLRYVRVTLPGAINARLQVITRACRRDEFEAGHCSQAKAGSAIAYTPLLRGPLRGNAYFVWNGHPIPDLFVALRGQVAFDLVGRVSIVHNIHLVTTFNRIPDVPISRFTLQLAAGARGSLGATVNLCGSRARAATAGLTFGGQNGRVLVTNQPFVIRGCPKAKRR